MYIDKKNPETIFTDDPSKAIPGAYPRIVVNETDLNLMVAALLDHGWRGVVCEPHPESSNQEPLFTFNSKMMLSAAKSVFGINGFTTRIMNECIREMGGEVLRSNRTYHYGFRLDQYYTLIGDVKKAEIISIYWPSIENVTRLQQEKAA
ncbi:hypothetical protein LGM35_06435 [Burkholderia cenocepacia]|uniref:hypothetical protein n=1 Tax=Burkholderia cenocepacia TaxID=95486 RepID=UPI001CF11C50|nr:hypothetical protein [Burkholderia cenocepacia]MCA7922118.1 hypothetical protein [Burkholderia cenocepacia]